MEKNLKFELKKGDLTHNGPQAVVVRNFLFYYQVVRRKMAGWTGLEPAASAVTGRRYNQLNYHPAIGALRIRI